MELHGCDGLRMMGDGGFLYLMITYNTWVYTRSATGFGDVGPIHRSWEREGEVTNMKAIPLSFKYYYSLLIW